MSFFPTYTYNTPAVYKIMLFIKNLSVRLEQEQQSKNAFGSVLICRIWFDSLRSGLRFRKVVSFCVFLCPIPHENCLRPASLWFSAAPWSKSMDTVSCSCGVHELCALCVLGDNDNAIFDSASWTEEMGTLAIKKGSQREQRI
jgi:hypothetical protein